MKGKAISLTHCPQIVSLFIGRAIELSPVFLKILTMSTIVMFDTASHDLAGFAGCF
ncbi:MAG: hypothetical protein NT013_08180 [Planctomycetia bacterium]|nr:hypothetical protein [Planctomycetia bacterium]